MMDSSNKIASINYSRVPILEGAIPLIKNEMVPGGTFKNLNSISENILFDSNIDDYKKILMADAQTSGGLIISVDTTKLPELLKSINQNNIYEASVIGNVRDKESSSVSIEVSL